MVATAPGDGQRENPDRKMTDRPRPPLRRTRIDHGFAGEKAAPPAGQNVSCANDVLNSPGNPVTQCTDMKEAAPRTIRLSDYQPPSHLVQKVRLTFDLREDGARVSSWLQVRKNPAFAGEADQWFLYGEELDLQWLAVDGRRLQASDYRLEEGGLRLLDLPQTFEFSSEVLIAPHENTALEGLYRSGGMFCTQCEAEGFRKITWYPDRPDVMAPFEVRIEAEQARYPVLLSNGNPGASGDLPQGRHFAEWHDPFPKPSYLFALVAGDLRFIERDYSTASGRPVRLRIYVEPENIDRCDYAMDSLVRAMRWDEEKYGREYDLDVFNIVAVNDFNMGAMENKGLNVFNSKFILASAATATDHDFQGIEGVVAHEYFHNWTGNRITCRDWFQLSLKEGLTVYRDQEFSADMGSRGVKRIDDVRLLRAHQFAEDAGPMAHPVRPDSYIEINNFYTVTVYEKGAEVVRMQARLLGPEAFRRGMDLYFERHDGQAVTTEDFVACMQAASGRDLSRFRHWYDYAGTPQLQVSDAYDGDRREYRLSVRQAVPDTPGQSDKPAYLIPFALGLLDSRGADMDLKLPGIEAREGSLMLELRATEQTFLFEGVAEKPVPSLLRGFSAPVKVDYAWSDEQLLHLMAFDSDGFNRWDAGQTLLQRVILRLVDAFRAGSGLSVPHSLIDAIRTIVCDRDGESALAAELLTLPGMGYLGDFMPVVDIEGLHAAREAVRHAVADALKADLVQRYGELQDEGPYQVDAEHIGRRRLRNTLLAYLASLADSETDQLVAGQYAAGHNMTDVMAALSLLAEGEHPQRAQALAGFEARWGRDALVMDKWFGVQASANRASVLHEVHALMQHPAFSLKNPNKVRALIGAFVNANPLHFHAADGSGYRFLADQVLALDPVNPQIAARLLRAMARWRRFDEGRQGLMREQFERVLQSEASKDVYEVAAKSLETA